MTDSERKKLDIKWKLTFGVSILAVVLSAYSQLLASSRYDSSNLEAQFELKADKEDLQNLGKDVKSIEDKLDNDVATVGYVKETIKNHENLDQARHKRMEDLFKLSIKHSEETMAKMEANNDKAIARIEQSIKNNH